MKEIVIGLFTGIISGLIVSEIYRKFQLKVEKDFDFKNDVQIFSKTFGVIKNELELYDKTKNNEFLLRALNEPRMYHSFTDNNLSNEASSIISNANILLNELEEDLKSGEILDKQKLTKYKIGLFDARLNILRIKPNKK